ncbi:MAG TPA: L,D-transpeptidase [Methylovirgula sp.]|jgi:lipoprotein-anchoring transpeptidase ErfK/SrfK
MSQSRVLSLLLVSAASCAIATAAAADPMVVHGIYPKVQPDAQSQAYNQPAGSAQDQSAPQMQAPVSAPAPAGSYGGGFLEMLMTGHVDQSPPPSAQSQMMALSVNPDPRAQHEIDPQFKRQEVDYSGPQKAGTIVVDTKDKFLFLVEKNGRAMRYGIGVGREGFTWSGIEKISRKAEWPDWTPPDDMLKRRPDLPTHMDGGPQNPLGARALYLGASLYRIHGTNEPYTIGTNVSSGCIRMMNEDVEDLYDRVKVGTQVVVM